MLSEREGHPGEWERCGSGASGARCRSMFCSMHMCVCEPESRYGEHAKYFESSAPCEHASKVLTRSGVAETCILVRCKPGRMSYSLRIDKGQG